MRRIIAVDWDDTLVDSDTQEWLVDPATGASAKQVIPILLTRFHAVIVHTCRANWPEGRAQVEAKLLESVSKPWQSSLGDRLRIEPKPRADIYIDNRGGRFGGSWSEMLPYLDAIFAEPVPA